MGVICWKIPCSVAMGKIWQNVFFLALFWVMRSNRSIRLFFIKPWSENTAHQTRLTFDLEIETTHCHSSLLRTRPHDDGWQRWRVYLGPCPRTWEVACVVLWSSVTSSQNAVFRPLGDDRVFVSIFCTPAAKCVLTEAWSAPATNPGRRVSAVHQGGVGAPNELATFRVHDAVVYFVERSVWRTRNCARLIQDLLEKFSGRCWPRSPPEIIFYRNSGKFRKIILPKLGP